MSELSAPIITACFGAISALVAALVYASAMRRDRRQRILQVEIERLEELRNVLGEVVQYGACFSRFKDLQEEQNAELQAQLKEKELEFRSKQIELDASRKSAVSKARLLAEISYQEHLSDELVAAVQEAPNVGKLIDVASQYMAAEWSRILAGKKASPRPLMSI